MKFTTKLASAGLATALMTSTAMAGGLERGTWSPSILFEKGNYIEGSWARVNPDVTGGAFGVSISNINPSYTQLGFAMKLDLSDTLAISLTSYEPSGYDLAYPLTPLTAVPTSAHVESRAYAAVAKLNLGEGFDIYGGINYVTVKGTATNLPGAPFPDFQFGSDSDIGYIAGVAYSKPEIALRISLTYESGTDHNLSTTAAPAVGGPFVIPIPIATTGGSPEAYTLHFQSGIAADTLLFGSIRHAVHSDKDIILNGMSNLTSFSDEQTYVLGIGRKINDTLSVSFSGTYEDGSGNASSLNPTDGKFTASTGFKYLVTENMEFSAGASYTWVGDNTTATVPAVPFTGNNALAYGAKIGFRF